MSPRFLSESEAWRTIAERIAAKPVGCYEYLCWHFDPAYEAGRVVGVSGETRQVMRARIEAHLSAALMPIAIQTDKNNPRERLDVRVLAALFLALEAEDEQRAARKAGAQ